MGKRTRQQSAQPQIWPNLAQPWPNVAQAVRELASKLDQTSAISGQTLQNIVRCWSCFARVPVGSVGVVVFTWGYSLLIWSHTYRNLGFGHLTGGTRSSPPPAGPPDAGEAPVGRSIAITRRDEHGRRRPVDLGCLEATFVAKMLRRSPKPQLPRTHWMSCESAGATWIH